MNLFGIRAIGLAVLTLALAASSAHAANPKSCNDLWLQENQNGTTLPDGDYVIEPTPGMVFTVYCKDIATTPKDYLTLPNTGGSFNYSQIAAGGAFPGMTVKTSFTKIRIDPKTFLVDIGDLTFATSTGSITQGASSLTAVPFGVAADCVYFGSSTGRANIDLTGTPFAVNSTFATEGWAPAGSVNGVALTANNLSSSAFGKVVNLTGGGYCGATGPDGFNSSFDTWVYAPRTAQLALKLQYVGN